MIIIWNSRYRDRALLLKRHGDAYLRAPTAKPDFVKTLPADRLKGLLCLTDSALLYNYSHFCDEKAKAKPLPGIYDSSSGLRTFVRKEWEHEMRRGEGSDGEEGSKERERERERARAMAGLMYLLEAVIMYQTGKDSLAILQHRGKELHATLASPHDNPSPPGFIATPSPTNPSHNGSHTASATTAAANSNTGANHSSAHPPNHSPTSAHSSTQIGRAHV